LKEKGFLAIFKGYEIINQSNTRPRYLTVCEPLV
jgi:hypothetical protein